MKAKLLISSLLAFTLSVSAQAAPALSKKRLGEIVRHIEYRIADTQVCGQGMEARSSEFLELSRDIESNLMTLFDLAGYDAVAYLNGQSEKLAIVREMELMRYETSADKRSYCDVAHKLAVHVNATLKAEAQKLRPRSKPHSKPRAQVSDCPLSADTYQQRFHKNGKTSDLICFQRAGVRELEEAQQL
ncbi:MAG: hypothetical protein ACXW1F_07815 [Halobacteriota archaeon]